MLHERRGDLTIENLKALSTGSVLELGFDLKAGSPLSWDKADQTARQKNQSEFLSDISSFANQHGGVLIYGIKEGSGVVEGIPDANSDQIMLAVTTLCRKHLDPPLIPKMYFVEGAEKGPVLVLEIPDSWAKPHMVTMNDQTILKIRTNTGKVTMDATTLRRVVLGAHERADRIEKFLESEARRAATSPRAPLRANAGYFLGIVPVATFGGNVLSLTQINHKIVPTVHNHAGFDGHHNLDGYLSVHTERDGTCLGYVQVFRDGSLFIVEVDEVPKIRNRFVIDSFLKSLAETAVFHQGEGIRGPFALTLGHFGKRGAQTEQMSNYGRQRQIQEDFVRLPVVVGELRSEETLTALFRLLVQTFHAKDLDPQEIALIQQITGKKSAP